MSVKTGANEWQRACDGVMGVLSTLGSSKSTLEDYSRYYRLLLSFLAQRKLIDKPVDKKNIDAFHRFLDIESYRLTSQYFYNCARRRLLEFHEKGFFDQYPKATIPVSLPASYETILVEYQKFRDTESFCTSERSEQQYIREVRAFLHCLHQRRRTSLRRISFEDVQAFIKQNPHLSSSTMTRKASVLRSFFRFLIETKKNSATLLDFVPRFRYVKAFHLAVIWPQADVKKLLSVVDRKTAAGKRDYAIILLVTKLGLRIGDVKNLKIENINWRKATIQITQQKTKNPLELPISEDIGNALIDYLTNGRPSVSSRHVFVMHRSPYRNYAYSNGMSEILSKYKTMAGINLVEEGSQRWHSLRHSLATRLHEDSTPLPVIAAILGHASLETTRLYARTNIEMLRSVALEWEES